MRLIFKILFSLVLTLNIACQKPSVYQSQIEEVFPPVVMKHVALYRMDGLPISSSFFRGQWTLVIFGQASCPDDCRQRLALVNEVKSINRLFVINDLADSSQMKALGRQFTEVPISMGTTAVSFDKFYAQFFDASGGPELVPSRIYLVNPEAELSYSLNQDGLKTGDIVRELQLLGIQS